MSEKLELQTENFKLCQKGLELMKVLEEGFLKLGEVLMEIRDTQAFYPQWEDFGSYLAERKMSEANASKLITVYNRYIIKMQLPHQKVADLPWTILYEMHLLYPDNNELVEAMEDGTPKNTSDLRQQLVEKKRGVNQDTCAHADSYTISVCKTCGKRTKIYDQE